MCGHNVCIAIKLCTFDLHTHDMINCVIKNNIYKITTDYYNRFLHTLTGKPLNTTIIKFNFIANLFTNSYSKRNAEQFIINISLQILTKVFIGHLLHTDNKEVQSLQNLHQNRK